MTIIFALYLSVLCQLCIQIVVLFYSQREPLGGRVYAG